MVRNVMVAAVLVMLASAAAADPVHSRGRTFELRPAVSAPVAPVASCVAALSQPLAAPKPAAESKKDCSEFAGMQMIRFFASSVEAVKDSRGQLAMPSGEGVRIVAY